MASTSESNLIGQLDRSGDVSLNLSLSNGVLSSGNRTRATGIPLLPGLRPDVYTVVSFKLLFVTEKS